MDETNKQGQCAQCGGPLGVQGRGRPRKYCSASCRQQAYEKRNGLPNWKQQQEVRESERRLSKLARRRDREVERRSAAVKLELEHRSHTDPFACVGEIFRYEVAIAEVIEFASFLVLESDVGEDAAGINLGRVIQQLVDDVKLTGFRAVPLNDSVESAERRWAVSGVRPGRSRIVAELNQQTAFARYLMSPVGPPAPRP